MYFHYISHSLFFGAKFYIKFSKCYSEFLIDVVRLESLSPMFYKIGVLKNFAEFS